MDRRAFLGVSLVGIVPLIGCGGGKKSGGSSDGTLKNSAAYAVTPSGRLIGGVKTVGGHGHAWLWTDGLTPSGGTDIHPAGYTDSVLIALSDDGSVRGLDLILADGTTHAALWNNGVLTDLHPPGAESESHVHWVSADGTLQRGSVGSPGRLVQWRGTAASRVDLPGGPDPSAGTIAYSSADGSVQVDSVSVTDPTIVIHPGLPTIVPHATLWKAGAMTDLHPAGMLESNGNGISRNGRFQCGQCKLPTDSKDFSGDLPVFLRAVVWEGSAASARFLHPDGWFYTSATHVSDDGRLVAGDGHRTNEAIDAIFTDVGKAVLWVGGTASGFVDLHALLPNPGGFKQSRVDGVDDAGNLVGSATDLDDNVYAIYWTASV